MLADKQIVYNDKDFAVYLQYSNVGPVIHVDVHNWSLRVYKKGREFFDLFKKSLRGEGYGVLYAPSIDDKQTYFASMFGFDFTDGYIMLTDNKVYPVLAIDLMENKDGS